MRANPLLDRKAVFRVADDKATDARRDFSSQVSGLKDPEAATDTKIPCIAVGDPCSPGITNPGRNEVERRSTGHRPGDRRCQRRREILAEVIEPSTDTMADSERR